MEIMAKSAEEAWKRTLKYIFENGKDFVDIDNRICREVLNIIVKVENTKWITKPIEIINSFGKWVYPPIEELESFILSKKEIPGYYYNYGARAFKFDAINQVDNFIVPLLKKDKTSRRITVIFYDPKKDSSLFKKDIPAMIMINFNIRQDKIHATSIIRSNDLFFGWPANLYQTFVLLNYVAKQTGYQPGSITTISVSAHIFEEQFEYIKKLISRD